jgi:coenzyme F420-reducing hydrogenase alpha subunit
LKEEDRSFEIRAGRGSAMTEAPRGVLYHDYSFDENGVITRADIVTPTAENSKEIENNFRSMIPTIADLTEEEATLRCEMLVRAYDPCISCSVHYIKVD